LNFKASFSSYIYVLSIDADEVFLVGNKPKYLNTIKILFLYEKNNK